MELARDPRQMREMIENGLRHPEHRREERRKLIDRMFGSTLDGRCANRVAETLLQIGVNDGLQR